MSKYNEYAKRLDKSFKDAREKYLDAYKKLLTAEKEYEKVSTYLPGESNYTWEERKAAANLELVKAQNAFEMTKKESWGSFKESVKHLREEFNNELNKNSLADPEDVDLRTIKLLESEMLSFSDVANMAKLYEDNITMLRIIGKHSRKMALSTEDKEERTMYNALADSTTHGTKKKAEEFDGLVNQAMIFAGQTRENNSNEFIANISQHWEEIQGAIDNF